jgi:hypothetical protein
MSDVAGRAPSVALRFARISADSWGGTPHARAAGGRAVDMMTALLTFAFALGVPTWLLVEEIVHRSRVRVAFRPRAVSAARRSPSRMSTRPSAA